MKTKHLIAALVLMTGFAATAADEPFVNLTPAPVSMTVNESTFTLPQGFTVGGNNQYAEVDRFLADINKATGLNGTKTDAAEATIRLLDVDCAANSYSLSISESGIEISSGGGEGLYYALQTLKKILPANVMAGVYEEKEYTLPCLEISDYPRMEYRGFMLDCSRHFFTVAEVKRMLDVMSYYKMNKFHWHLTDDQGWRIEMPQYPRLTTVGATASNVEIVDMYTKTDYWLNKSYGPYFYTQDELREVVAYAKERYIEIIPEVEMPGHFSAVMAAYPEFSLNPDGGHSVAVTGGVYGDVMNLANPAAIKFAEDVIDVLADIFPSKIIHIGGDECPSGGWVNINDKGVITGGNEECIAMYKREGCTHPRQLQSIFTKHMADYAATKGRTIGVWNESICSQGTDENLMKQTDATVWCWTGPDAAIDKAASLGLRAVYTPYSKSSDTKGSFYINRSQHPDDPPANGYKCDDVKSVYATIPFTTGALKNHPELCYGVQGTFWCERVAYREYLEYLALPRLIAIAEIGWTQQKNKNWESFQKRMSADRELLDYNDYKYSPYHMLDDGQGTPETPDLSMPAFEAGAHYVFTSAATAYAGAMLADNGSGVLAHSTSPWDNTIWTVGETSENTDKSHNLTLTNYLSGKAIASVGQASGRIAKPVNLGDAATTLKAWRYDGDKPEFMLAIGADALWSIPASGSVAPATVRAGETKNEGGVSPIQGAVWTAVKVDPRQVTGVTTDGRTIFTGTRGIPVGETDYSNYAPEIPCYTMQSYNVTAEGTINYTYEQTSRIVTYVGQLENGAYVQHMQTVVPVDAEIPAEIPEVDGCTLVTAGQPVQDPLTDNITYNSVFTTDAHVGVGRPFEKLTSVEAGKAYLIRDAHVDRNAFRCATTASTVNGAKSADGVSPMFTWTLEERNGKFAVKNLATDQYIQTLQRSQTAKLGKVAAVFTFTYDTDHWNVLGSNGMYWDGLDNLDLVGWDGGTGHPIEVYSFLAAFFHKVNISHVDSKGTLLGTETRYARAGEPFILGLPYRNGYTITSVEGNEQLADLKADADVRIIYTSDAELSISEITAESDATGPVYDLQGRRVASPRRGLYIAGGRKVILR